MGEIKESAHTKWRCEYHIVFAPKYRRKEIYGKLKADIGQILRKLCEEKKVEILEAQACPDHIHMLVSVPPHLSIAQFMGYLKGKSSLMIFDRVGLSNILDRELARRKPAKRPHGEIVGAAVVDGKLLSKVDQ